MLGTSPWGKGVGSPPWAPDCAHARLNPGEQLPQKQLSCCTAWSWWDHILRFPSANLTIETSPLCQYLPSTGDKVATSHQCRNFSPLRLAVEGQLGSQAAPRGGGSCQLSPQSPLQQCKESQDPSTLLHTSSGAWDGCCCQGHHCLCHPALGISTAPHSCQSPHLCTMTAISTMSASP